MAFGQQSGPPATGRQIQELLSLLQEAGHSDFRDARGPMGFNQRQAGGKFSRDEVAAFIEQLQQEAEAAQSGAPPAPEPAPTIAARPKAKAKAATARPKAATPSVDPLLAPLPSEQLAAELQRRGWIVVEP